MEISIKYNKTLQKFYIQMLKSKLQWLDLSFSEVNDSMIYAVYSSNPAEPERTIFIKDGFSVSALCFSVLWFFYNKLWITGTIILITNIFLKYLHIKSDSVLPMLALLMLNLFCGMFGNDFKQLRMMRKGYKFISAVVAHNAVEAKVKFYNSLDKIEYNDGQC